MAVRAACYDVAVVGGGPAGIAAALAAAGLGARTLLVERAPQLGGNATQAFVHTICGLYALAPEGAASRDARPEPAQAGFALRFAEQLRAYGAAGDPVRMGRVFVLPTEPRRIAAVAAGLCVAETRLEVRLGATLVAARLASDAGASSTLEVAPRASAVAAGAVVAERVRAHALVDTSGDGVLAALGAAEVEQEPAERLQRPAFIFSLRDVDPAAVAGFEKMRVSLAVAGAVREGALPAGCESVTVRPALADDRVYVTLNLPRDADLPAASQPAAASDDLLDPQERARLEARAQGWARQVAARLRSTQPGFARARIDALPRRLGVRETRRVRGRVVISRDDILSARRRDDEVAVSSWPIEMWHDHRRAHFSYPRGVASVPLGALVSRSHPRLAAAGRCLSATHEAHGALRVIATALATGEAAGAAAALAVDAGVALGDVEAEAVRRAITRLDEHAPRARAQQEGRV